MKAMGPAMGLALIPLALLAACGGGEKPAATSIAAITIEELIGLWLGPGGYVQFNEGGTFRVDDTSLENLEVNPDDMGQFRLEGSVLALITNEISRFCAGEAGTYEVGLTEQGQLQFVLREDPCTARAEVLPSAPWSLSP